MSQNSVTSMKFVYRQAHFSITIRANFLGLKQSRYYFDIQYDNQFFCVTIRLCVRPPPTSFLWHHLPLFSSSSKKILFIMFAFKKALPFFFFLISTYCTAKAIAANSDFIIVGGGTSGCVLAARLCALRPDLTVTLLERSFPRNATQEFLVRAPRQMLLSWFTEDLTESFQTLPVQGLKNRTASLFDGKTLGGTSSINGMQLSIPISGDIEKWGIRGLNSRNIRRYLATVQKTVNFQIPKGNARHRYVKPALKAAERTGFKVTTDPFLNSNSRFIGENYLAVGKNGYRRDSCSSYLSPVIEKQCKHNLRLIQGITVTKIRLSNSKPKRAIGVHFIRSYDKSLKDVKEMRAQREVIICAGPFGSPKLLQLSGIGPPSVLRDAGVKSQVSLPVGQTVQGRVVVPIEADYNGVPLAPSMNSTILFSPKSRRMFDKGLGGPWSQAASFAIGKVGQSAYFAMNSNTFPAYVDRSAFNAGCISNEKGNGWLAIRSSSSFDKPQINLAVLEAKDRSDIQGLKKCVNLMIQIFKRYPKRFNIAISSPVGERVTEDWIRSTAVWNGHFIGGCSVGSVVRDDLRVYKTRGLRVVDASVLPNMPTSAGPISSVYLIAEHMAKIIGSRSTNHGKSWWFVKPLRRCGAN